MSLVGTRPILQDELQKYELHHRARIAIKPGITGMWQVSGRSDITDFEEVVRLDTEYISIPSATGSAKKAAFAPKKEGRTAALITKRDFLVTESASPVFGHSRAVSPSTKTYWKLSGMIISV